MTVPGDDKKSVKLSWGIPHGGEHPHKAGTKLKGKKRAGIWTE